MNHPPGRIWTRTKAGMYRLDQTECRMRCVFCPTSRSLTPLSAPGSSPLETMPADFTRRVLAEVEQILAAVPPDLSIHLTANDLMAFEGFFDILAVFRRHGRHLTIDSPGLRLADPAFAEQASRYDIHVNISCQGASDPVYTAMCGNPEAFTLVRSAIGNLRRFGIPFGVNCVITAVNCGALFDIARFLFVDMGLDTFALLHFYPEQALLDLNPDAWDLLPSYAQIDEQLARIGALCTERDRRTKVVDVAPCQLRSTVVSNPRIHLDFVHGRRFQTDSPTSRYRAPSCEHCVVGEQCPSVSQHYIERDPHMTFDALRVKRDLALRDRLRPGRRIATR